jgi:riboflavin biosynthesis pyrimidine reductase
MHVGCGAELWAEFFRVMRRGMDVLMPLESLYEVKYDGDLPLPPELATLYGRLHFPARRDRAYVIGNFVTTLDGVVTLNVPGKSGGGPISGFNQHDHAVMGLLRAAADAVIVGAGTQRVAARHVWSAEYIYPEFAESYRQLREAMGKTDAPLNVIVSARGEVDFGLRVFQSGEVPVLIVTTMQGEERIRERGMPIPPRVQVSVVPGEGSSSAEAILQAVQGMRGVRECDIILVEGGPRLMGDFFAERLLDELFLTLAPQIAGRDEVTERAGLVMGQLFAPEQPLWGRLLSIKRGGSHLFLRYGFEVREMKHYLLS